MVVLRIIVETYVGKHLAGERSLWLRVGGTYPVGWGPRLNKKEKAS